VSREELLDALAWWKIKRPGSVSYWLITEIRVEENLMTLNALPALDICSQRGGEGGRNFCKCGLCDCVVGIQVYLPATWLVSMRGKTSTWQTDL
jgi:hypothetical protein